MPKKRLRIKAAQSGRGGDQAEGLKGGGREVAEKTSRSTDPTCSHLNSGITPRTKRPKNTSTPLRLEPQVPSATAHQSSPEVVTPPTSFHHRALKSCSSSFLSPDGDTSMEVTWDYRQTESTPPGSEERDFKDILHSFPAVDSPVARHHHRLTVPLPLLPLNRNHRIRHQLNDREGLERLRHLANLLCSQAGVAMPTKQQQQQESTKSMHSLRGREESMANCSHGASPGTCSQLEQGGGEREKENLVTVEDSERELSIDSFCERESVLEQLFCDMEDTPWEKEEEEEGREPCSPQAKPSPAIALAATTAASTVYPTHPSSCHLDPSSTPPSSSYTRLPHPPSHPQISHPHSSHPNCLTSHLRPQPTHVVSTKTSLPHTSTSSTATSSATHGSAAGEFEDEEDQVFWTMVVNTLDEEEEGQQQSGEEEEALDDVIDQLFFDAVDDVNQQQSHQGLPPPLPADRSDKDEEMHVPCRRVCSQQDIERKRQLAKRKLQQRLRTM